MGEIDWGNVPTWLSSIFAACAAGAAFGTLRSQSRQIEEQRTFIAKQELVLELQQRALLAEAAERKRTRVQRVRIHVSVQDACTEGVEGEGRILAAYISNDTSAPIYDVEVRFGDEAAPTWRDVDDTGMVTGPMLPPPARTHEPGILLKFVSLPHQRVDSRMLARELRPVVHFTDLDGHRWHLDEYGQLKEITRSDHRG